MGDQGRSARLKPAQNELEQDLRRLGRAEARIILNVIDERIIHGEPDKLSKPLAGDLSGCRRIRTGQTRIIYRVESERIEVLIIAVGMRRDNEIYESASNRADAASRA